MGKSSSEFSRETVLLALFFLETFEILLCEGFCYTTISGLSSVAFVPKYISYDEIPSHGCISQSISGAEAVAT